jgi:hypothetical protein
LARRRPSTANDQVVSSTTNSRAAEKNAVSHPVHPSPAFAARARTTPAAPDATGAHFGNRAPTSADGVTLVAGRTIVVIWSTGFLVPWPSPLPAWTGR